MLNVLAVDESLNVTCGLFHFVCTEALCSVPIRIVTSAIDATYCILGNGSFLGLNNKDRLLKLSSLSVHVRVLV